MTSDGDDVAAVLAGDIDRFEQIVRRYKRPLMQLALRFTSDRSMAEEMAHDAFISCYRSLGTWRHDSAFSTWLFSVALNVYRARLRRIQPRFVPLDEALLFETDHESTVSEEQEAAIIRRSVTLLPAKYRDPLVIFYCREADLRETASILGIPEGTVKTRLHRGRRLLARRLEKLLRGRR